MSGVMPLPRWHFYRRLRRRRLNAAKLAAKIVSGRTHVTEVINGTKESPRTWHRLARHLKPEELALLGRDSNGDLVEQEVRGMPLPAPVIVPRATKSPQRLFASCEVDA
jgi:hypothetical protein